MNVEPILQRVEHGLATAADAKALRQAFALQAVQFNAQRQETLEACAALRHWLALVAQLRAATKDYVAYRTQEYLTAMVQVQRDVDWQLLQEAGKNG